MHKRIVLLAGSMLVGTTIGVVSLPVTATAAPILGTAPSVAMSLPSAGDCTGLGLGTVVTAVIKVAAQSDCFSFAGAKGDRIRVRVVETLGQLFAQTRVLRPDGTEVCGRNVYRESTCLLDTTGIHQLRISDDTGTALGNYSLNIQRLNDPVGCSVLAYGRTVSDSILVPAQTTCWTFSASAGKVVRIRTQGTFATVNPETEVVRPDGSTVCPYATAWERTCTLDVTGTYTLLGKDNPGTGIGDYDLNLGCDTPPCRPEAAVDFDADGKSDLGVYRRSTGTWYVGQTAGEALVTTWGNSDDIPLAADYDGDAKADVAVYRPSNGTWYVKGSKVGAAIATWGIAGDIPVPADYDGDGRVDLAVYRPSSGGWYVYRSSGGTSVVIWGGATSDVPVPADYDGDGRADVAVYRATNGTWHVSASTAGNKLVTWGASGDVAVPADYDGDGKADAAVYRPSTGTWYLNRSSRGPAVVTWGTSGDVPVAADYDGDGKTDVTVFRPSTGQWWISRSTSGPAVPVWGIHGDSPLRSR